MSSWVTRCRWLLLAASATAVVVTTQPLSAAAGDREPPGPRPFQPVLQTRLRGDLLMAGNANVVSTGPRPGATSSVDVDDDASFLCVGRRRGDAACADNSSSALIDLPARARVVNARLYVETSLPAGAGAMSVGLSVPGRSFAYMELGADTPAVPKLYEALGSGRDGSSVRQAVWDVTQAVAAGGAGRYTVADIVSERTGTSSPYASWAIVLAYELRPNRELTDLRPALRPRFAQRIVSWHDGIRHALRPEPEDRDPRARERRRSRRVRQELPPRRPTASWLVRQHSPQRPATREQPHARRQRPSAWRGPRPSPVVQQHHQHLQQDELRARDTGAAAAGEHGQGSTWTSCASPTAICPPEAIGRSSRSVPPGVGHWLRGCSRCRSTSESADQ